MPRAVTQLALAASLLLMPAAAAAGTGSEAHQMMPDHAGHAAPATAPVDMDSFTFGDGGLATLNAELSERRGITIEGVRLTGEGTMIDYRYRIVDAQKAAALHGQHVRPHLIDEATKAQFEVPFASKVGSLRQSSKPPVQGRTYVILFSNPGRTVASGDTVSIEQADLRITGIPVQ